jgi:fatty acid desaturase
MGVQQVNRKSMDPVESLEATLKRESFSSLREQVPKALLIEATVGSLLKEAAIEWSCILLCWVVMLAVEELRLVGVVLLAGRLHALGVILHDACHLKKTSLWLDLFCGWWLMMTTTSMRYHHLRHHRDTNQPTDPYFKPKAANSWLWWSWALGRHLFLFPFFALRAPVGLLAFSIPSLRTFYGRVFLQDRSKSDLSQHPEVLACCKAEAGLLFFEMLVCIAWWFFPTALLWGYLLPGLLAGLLAGWRVMSEHSYQPLKDRRLDSVLSVTRNHGLGWLGRLWTAPRNVGYHRVHHAHPQVAGKHLPALNAWYKANGC